MLCYAMLPYLKRETHATVRELGRRRRRARRKGIGKYEVRYLRYYR